MKKTPILRIFLTVWAVGATLCASGQSSSVKQLEITVDKAGTLESLVGSDTEATSLIVKGTIDVRDLDFISDSMTKLEALNLDDTRIAAYDGFRGLTAQEHFDADVLPSMSLAGLKATSIILPSTLTAINDGALAGCSITTLAIPTSVTSLGSGVFAGCNNLTAVTIPPTVTSVGSSLFSGCENLKTVYYNASKIGAKSFEGCTKLATFYPSETTTAIGESAFADCSSLRQIELTDRLTKLETIGAEAFRKSGLVRIDLVKSTSLTTIGDWAFADCADLEEVALSPTVTSLGNSTFFNDTKLASVTGLNSLDTVGEATWKDASAMTTIALGNSVETIGRYAFYDMTSLTNLTLPGALTYIGDYAFAGADNLQEMDAPALYQVPDLGVDVWGDLERSTVTLSVPETMISDFSATPVWQDFKIVTASSTTQFVESIDDRIVNVEVRYDGETLALISNELITLVQLYDSAGRSLTTVQPDSCEAVIEVSRWAPGVILGRVLVENGNPVLFKVSH